MQNVYLDATLDNLVSKIELEQAGKRNFEFFIYDYDDLRMYITNDF